MNELEIIRLVRAGDPAVYGLLTSEYGRLLWAVAANILSDVGTREDVEEVVADVFIALWEKPEQFDGSRGTLRSFLCLKAKTGAVDRLRKLRRCPVLALEDQAEPVEEGWQDAVLDRLSLEELTRQLDALPPPEGEVLALRFVWELKPAEIAAKLGLPLTQVYEHIRRGKARLAAAVRQEEQT